MKKPNICIFELIDSGDIESIKLWVKSEREFKLKKKGYTPLTYSLINFSSKNEEISLIFIEKSMYVNWPDKDGHSPLHWAVHSNYLKSIRLLIDNGENINSLDSQDEPPLLTAMKLIRFEAAVILLNNGASILSKNNYVNYYLRGVGKQYLSPNTKKIFLIKRLFNFHLKLQIFINMCRKNAFINSNSSFRFLQTLKLSFTL